MSSGYKMKITVTAKLFWIKLDKAEISGSSEIAFFATCVTFKKYVNTISIIYLHYFYRFKKHFLINMFYLVVSM